MRRSLIEPMFVRKNVTLSKRLRNVKPELISGKYSTSSRDSRRESCN